MKTVLDLLIPHDKRSIAEQAFEPLSFFSLHLAFAFHLCILFDKYFIYLYCTIMHKKRLATLVPILSKKGYVMLPCMFRNSGKS